MSAIKKVYESLPANKQSDTMDKIMNACEWSVSTFYRKINHPDLISRLEKVAIAKIFKMRTEDLFKELQSSMQDNFRKQKASHN